MRCRFWSKDCEVLWSSRKPAKSVRWRIKGVHDHSHHLDHITRCNTIIFTIWYNGIILTRGIYINLGWNYFSLTRWCNRAEETLFLGFFFSSGQGEGSCQLFWKGQSINIVLVVGYQAFQLLKWKCIGIVRYIGDSKTPGTGAHFVKERSEETRGGKKRW